jgi:hypothetical protein
MLLAEWAGELNRDWRNIERPSGSHKSGLITNLWAVRKWSSFCHANVEAPWNQRHRPSMSWTLLDTCQSFEPLWRKVTFSLQHQSNQHPASDSFFISICRCLAAKWGRKMWPNRCSGKESKSLDTNRPIPLYGRKDTIGSFG